MEEYKVGKARLVMTLRDSKDLKIRKAGIQVITVSRWSASIAVAEAESILKLKDVIGTTSVGKQGLGMTSRPSWNRSSQEERREQVQRERCVAWKRRGEEERLHR